MKNYFKKFSIMFVMTVILVLGCSISVFAVDTTYTGNLIPKMTSNTSPSGMVSASSTVSVCDAYLAFDKVSNRTDYYDVWEANSQTGWIYYKFDSAKIIGKYSLACTNAAQATLRMPKIWTFEGSNNGRDWTVLDTKENVTAWNYNEKKEFIINNNTSYIYYRVNVSANNGGEYLGIGEIEMMERVENKVSSIILDRLTMNLNVNDSQQLTATTDPAGAKVTWTSSDQSIVTVDSTGKVTAIKEGQAIITATTTDGSNLSATCTVTVTNPITPVISLNKISDSLTTGQTDNLVVTTTPAAVQVTWTSSDPSIATVDSTGKITAIKEGQASITATTADGLKATCIVTVANTTAPTENEYIVNTAYAKGDNTNNASGGVSIIFKGIAEAQLSVVKTADVDSVYVGDNFTYTLLVTNTSDKVAKAVVIKDAAPNHINFIVNGITTTEGKVDPSSTDKNVIVNVGDIQPLGTVTIKIPSTVVM